MQVVAAVRVGDAAGDKTLCQGVGPRASGGHNETTTPDRRRCGQLGVGWRMRIVDGCSGALVGLFSLTPTGSAKCEPCPNGAVPHCDLVLNTPTMALNGVELAASSAGDLPAMVPKKAACGREGNSAFGATVGDDRCCWLIDQWHYECCCQSICDIDGTLTWIDIMRIYVFQRHSTVTLILNTTKPQYEY
jgi:hypothetical protein